MNYFSEQELLVIRESMHGFDEDHILLRIEDLETKISIYFRSFYREEENFTYGNFEAFSKANIEEWRAKEPFFDLILNKVIRLLGKEFSYIVKLEENLLKKMQD